MMEYHTAMHFILSVQFVLCLLEKKSVLIYFGKIPDQNWMRHGTEHYTRYIFRDFIGFVGCYVYTSILPNGRHEHITSIA